MVRSIIEPQIVNIVASGLIILYSVLLLLQAKIKIYHLLSRKIFESMLVSEFEREVNGRIVSIKVYFKKVKYVRYRIVNNNIKISIPIYLSKNEKQKYIHQMLEKSLNHLERIGVNKFETPTHITIVGDEYQLLKNEGREVKFEYKNKHISYGENVDNGDAYKYLYKVINKNYLPIIKERIAYVNFITINKEISEINLKGNQSSWGLCTHNQKITISTNTLLTPLWVMDYVIVHELCHLKVKNHSTKFWNEVEKYYPKYKIAKKWLKENGSSVNLKNIFS